MRKFVLRTLTLALLLACLFTVTAFAEDGVLTGSDVNVRSGPGVNYQVIDCLARGTTVTVNDRSNAQWYYITVNGRSGFISADYVSIQAGYDPDLVLIIDDSPAIDVGAPAPVQAPPAAPEQAAPAPAPAGQSGSINAMYVRLRSGPSTDAAILGEFNRGTALTITGTSGEWTAVSINGKNGYVFSQYVSRSEAAAPVQEPAPVTVETVVEPVVEAPAPVQETRTAYISGDYVRFRSGPSLSAAILGIYNKGKPVGVTGASGDWTAVVIDGSSGYVSSQYIADSDPTAAPPQPETPAASAEAGYIKGNNVRLRAAASMSAAILGEYNWGTALTITGTAGEWTAVSINGQNGYVYSQYVASGAITVAPSDSAKGQQIAQFALQYVGYPYVWAGKSPSTGFDCSGLVYYVYSQFGYTLPRVANDQAGYGTAVDIGSLQPGDILCFYSGSSYVGHVGIYIGDNKFVHASTSTTGVIISELSGYYSTRGYTARRVV